MAPLSVYLKELKTDTGKTDSVMTRKYFIKAFVIFVIVAAVVGDARLPVDFLDEYVHLNGYQALKDSEECDRVAIVPLESLNNRPTWIWNIFRDSVQVIVNGDVPNELAKSLEDIVGDNLMFSDSLGITYYGDSEIMGYDLELPQGRNLIESFATSKDSYQTDEGQDFHPIYFYGDLDRFIVVDSTHSEVMRSVRVILIGDVGDGSTPLFLSADIDDAVPTPRGDMYSTVVLANVVCSLIDGRGFAIQEKQWSLLLCLFIFSVNTLMLECLSSKRYGYLKMKAVQVVEIVGLILISAFLLHYRMYVLSVNHLAFTIIVAVEGEYWLKRWIGIVPDSKVEAERK